MKAATASSSETYLIKYCRRCVMPETRPDLHIDEAGVCDACRNYDARTEIDWDRRKEALRDILKRYQRNSSGWDCVVPVSGGKDSTYQVIQMLELGMKPLCVNAGTCDLSDIGRRNLENLKNLGVDVVEFWPNPHVRHRLNRIALREVGDISWPEHVAIFTVPVRAAVQFNVPLIIWGENSQHEYGGPASAAKNNVLDRRWLEEFGGLLGLRVSDMAGRDGITAKDLTPYTYPTDEEMARVGVTGLFLGYYVPWDGYTCALVAQGHGFEFYPRAVEGTLLGYEKLDNYFHGIHDYFKFLKYGFGRATDHACMHIRRNRLSRADAVAMMGRLEGKFPRSYLGKPLEEMLKLIRMPMDEFVGLCDRFTNKRLFLKDSRGNLIKDREGNLSKINYDNP